MAELPFMDFAVADAINTKPTKPSLNSRLHHNKYPLIFAKTTPFLSSARLWTVYLMT